MRASREGASAAKKPAPSKPKPAKDDFDYDAPAVEYDSAEEAKKEKKRQ